MVNEQSCDDKHICHGCIGDKFLANEVNKEGTPIICSYCGQTRKGITLNTLETRIHEVLQEHFQLTPNQPEDYYEDFLHREGKWERRGESVNVVISEIAGLDESIVEDLIALLSEQYYSYESQRLGCENPYGWQAMYEERDAFDIGFHLTWEEFRRRIRFQSRFFLANDDDLLSGILGDVTTHRTHGDRPIVREINPDDHDRFIWRGRIAQSTQMLETILKSPVQELGPPPSKFAKAGRMNAQGISVLYGATDKSTCVSELRPPVGSSVVLGQFELLRTVRLLDLGALDEVYVSASYFDSEYATHKGRIAFLRELVYKITQPFMPEDEALEYLPTQVVAEYLAHEVIPGFDGMIYPSAQTDGSGQNMVIFHHASRVEPYDLPAASFVDVRIPDKAYLAQDDDIDHTIWVSETVSSNPAEEALSTGNGISRPKPIHLGYSLEEPKDDRHPTLRLDVESVVVLDIQGATYLSSRRSVNRRRQTEEERNSFDQRFADTFDIDDILEVQME